MSFAESEAQDWRRMVENSKRTKALLRHTERRKAGIGDHGSDVATFTTPVDVQMNVGWVVKGIRSIDKGMVTMVTLESTGKGLKKGTQLIDLGS